LLVPKIQDYGAERSLVEQFVDMVMSTTKNVVLICHEYEQTDDGGNVLGFSPYSQVRVVKPSRSGSVRCITLGRCEREWPGRRNAQLMLMDYTSSALALELQTTFSGLSQTFDRG